MRKFFVRKQLKLTQSPITNETRRRAPQSSFMTWILRKRVGNIGELCASVIKNIADLFPSDFFVELWNECKYLNECNIEEMIDDIHDKIKEEGLLVPEDMLYDLISVKVVTKKNWN